MSRRCDGPAEKPCAARWVHGHAANAAVLAARGAMVFAGFLPAANATGHDDYGHAWIKVCQYVEYHDD